MNQQYIEILKQFENILAKYKSDYKPKPTDYVFYINSHKWNDSGLIVRKFKGFEVIPHELIPSESIYFMQRQDLKFNPINQTNK